MIPPFNSFPLPVRLLLILALFFFNLVLFGFAGLLVVSAFYGIDIGKATSVCSGHFITDADKYCFLLFQGISSLGLFALTSLLISQWETRFVSKRLALGIKPAFKVIFIAVLSMLASQALIQVLVELNEKIPLPAALKFLADQGKEAEEVEAALMKGNSLIMLFANTIVFAIVPAIGEELFFRGLILGELLKSKVNPVAAIVSTGLLFSLAHAQFENILAIWALGSFLGYLYYISGSLWLSVIAHFTNNFLLVLLKYIYNAGLIKTDIAEADVPLYATIISIVLFFICLLALNKWRRPVDFELELSGPELINDENFSE